MRYGFFDDFAKEYVITRPDTPLPWINYLGSEGFFSLISNTGGGYSFYKDAKLRRITRFRYNNVPADEGGRSVNDPFHLTFPFPFGQNRAVCAVLPLYRSFLKAAPILYYIFLCMSIFFTYF